MTKVNDTVEKMKAEIELLKKKCAALEVDRSRNNNHHSMSELEKNASPINDFPEVKLNFFL